jgi:two-component system alkaline phosphatase synthesis response regulator PhoP
VVEDELGLRRGLLDLLKGAGHEVDGEADGEQALQRALATAYDLILLDLMLPTMDGIEVCRQLRAARPAQPVLMLTARGSESDKVAGLSAGADDYLAKPFGARELLARIDALARRLQAVPEDPEVLEVDGCTIDLGRLTALRDGCQVGITPREAGILRWLHRHRNRAVSRAELLERVWGASGDLQTRTVDMTIAKLRQKVERDPSRPAILTTVTGVGYAWGGR